MSVKFMTKDGLIDIPTGGSAGQGIISISQEDYDNLPEEKKNNGAYYIYDAPDGITVVEVNEKVNDINQNLGSFQLREKDGKAEYKLESEGADAWRPFSASNNIAFTMWYIADLYTESQNYRFNNYNTDYCSVDSDNVLTFKKDCKIKVCFQTWVNCANYTQYGVRTVTPYYNGNPLTEYKSTANAQYDYILSNFGNTMEFELSVKKGDTLAFRLTQGIHGTYNGAYISIFG